MGPTCLFYIPDGNCRVSACQSSNNGDRVAAKITSRFAVLQIIHFHYDLFKLSEVYFFTKLNRQRLDNCKSTCFENWRWDKTYIIHYVELTDHQSHEFFVISSENDDKHTWFITKYSCQAVVYCAMHRISQRTCSICIGLFWCRNMSMKWNGQTNLNKYVLKNESSLTCCGLVTDMPVK